MTRVKPSAKEDSPAVKKGRASKRTNKVTEDDKDSSEAETKERTSDEHGDVPKESMKRKSKDMTEIEGKNKNANKKRAKNKKAVAEENHKEDDFNDKHK
ncbi:uncharacterized protein [Cherax quadricarinatus]|uniref:uncharacterized protein n=1 Tax=Cherax quadricarinatus TaxID=27406 RepID=UPI00387E7B8B